MMKNYLLSLAAFDNINRVLTPFFQNIFHQKTNKNEQLARLYSLDKTQLLERANNHLEDVFLILQEKTLFQKFSPADWFDIFHRHPIIIQEIVQTKKVNKLLEQDDLMEIAHPDLVSAKYLFLQMGYSSEATKCRILLTQTHEEIAHDVLNCHSYNLTRKDLLRLAKNCPQVANRILGNDQLRKKLSDADKKILGKENKLNESPERSQARDEKFNVFLSAFSQHLQVVETYAIVMGVIEENKPSSEQIQLLSSLKHLKSVIFNKLTDNELSKLDSILNNEQAELKDYIAKLIFTRSIAKNAHNLLEKAFLSVKAIASHDKEKLMMAILIPHIVDYCHRTSSQKKLFIFSENEIVSLMQQCLASSREENSLEGTQQIVMNIALNIMNKQVKSIDKKIISQHELVDLNWFLEKLQHSGESLSTVEAFLEKIKLLKPQQNAISRYFAMGDVKNFKKVMGESSASLMELAYGPLPKNKYTRQLEYVVSTFLKIKDKKSIKIEKENNEVFISLEGVTFNLGKIVKYANFNHVEINEKLDDLYDAYLSAQSLIYTLPYEMPMIKSMSVNDTIFQMPRSGMHAINVHTGNMGHSTVNALLRNGPDKIYLDDIMWALCNAFFASLALNKTRERQANPVYRTVNGSGIVSSESPETLAKKGGVSKEAFFSTSITSVPFQEEFFSHNIFCETTAPFIAYLSKAFSENEVLIPPSRFQWTHLQEGTDGKKYFMVKEVAALNSFDSEELKGLVADDAAAYEVDEKGNTTLHFAVLFQTSLIEALLKQGADVNKANCNGTTPFHLVAKTGNEGLISLFLNAKAKLLVKDLSQKSPYDILKTLSLSDALKAEIETKTKEEDPHFVMAPAVVEPEVIAMECDARKLSTPLIELSAKKDTQVNTLTVIEPVLLPVKMDAESNLSSAEDKKRQRTVTPVRVEENTSAEESLFSQMTRRAMQALTWAFSASSSKRTIHITKDNTDDIVVSPKKNRRLGE